MSVLTLEGRIKPAPWNWQPQLVHPDVQGLFHGRYAIWPLWEGGGSVLTDVHGNRATTFSTPTWALENVGPVLRFGGADFVEFPYPLGKVIPVTLSMLVVFRSASATLNQVVASLSDSTAGTDITWRELRWNQGVADGTVGWIRKNATTGTSTVTNGTGGTVDGEWHAAIGTQNALNAARMWVDGEPAADSSATSISTGNLNNLAIGCTRETANLRFFTGDVAMVAAFDQPVGDGLGRMLTIDPFLLLRPHIRPVAVPNGLLFNHTYRRDFPLLRR